MSLSADFASEFCAWWNFLNPKWRVRVDGQPVAGGTGDWSIMAVPGINGFASIVAGCEGLLKTVSEAVDRHPDGGGSVQRKCGRRDDE